MRTNYLYVNIFFTLNSNNSNQVGRQGWTGTGKDGTSLSVPHGGYRVRLSGDIAMSDIDPATEAPEVLEVELTRILQPLKLYTKQKVPRIAEFSPVARLT